MVAKLSHLCKLAMMPLSLALSSAIIPLAVAADEASKTATLDTIVVTGTSAPAPLSEVPGSVDVVDHNELELVQHSHISESADRVAGVWVSRGNGQEHLTAIRSPVFSGPGSCGEFVMLEDGIPTRPAGFCNVNQLFEINSEQADRIEIFRGPASSVYGSNAVHGVINVLSPDVGVKEETRVKLDGGPHDYARGFVSYTDGNSLLVNAHTDHDGGYIDDSGFDQQKANVKYLVQKDDYRVVNFLEMTHLNQQTAGYLVGTDAYKDDHLRTTNSTPGAYRDAQSMHGYSRFIFQPDAERQWEITPYANASHMEFIQSYVPTEPLEKNGHDSAGVNGKFSYPLSGVSSDTLALHSGFNLETARAYVDEFQSQPSKTPPGYVQGQHYDFDVFMNSLDLSSDVDYRVLPDLHWLAGVNYNLQLYNYQSNTPANTVGIYTRPPSRDDKFGNWGYSTGAVWNWIPQHEMYLNASSGFRAPQVAELYRLQGGTPPDAVQSEQIDSVELGWRGNFKTAFDNKLLYELAIFDMSKTHVILQEANRQYLGNAETSHKGIELTLDYHFLQTAYVKTGLTYAEHRYVQVTGQLQGSPPVNLDGNMIDTAPRHFGTVQAGNAFNWGVLELEVVDMGRYYLNPENTLSYGGHDLLNLRAEWHVAPEWTLGARLLNVLNTDYAERADATPQSPLPRYFVGEPRSLYVSVEKTFH
jgi:outer membrane receptor protein involved in Fe transport